MMRMPLRTLVITTALAAAALEAPARAADWDKPGWQLTFQDEFDGSTVDASCRRTSTTHSSCRAAY
jgi:hypothetical protein